jgi:arsenite methyltransferase
MKEHDEIRSTVAQTYAKAVTRPKASSCCSTSDSGCETTKLSGYTGEDLQALPDDAVVNSFGCGNPLAFSEVKEGNTVLDLGSGAGIDLFIAAKKVGAAGRVIGVDMTDEMIARARENIAASEFDNIEVRKGIIEKLPVEDSSVDWVISNCVINLSPDKPEVFREIARVLKPGGRMSVSDIVVQGLPDWVRKNAALYSSCVAGAISEEEYLDGLRKAGLENVAVGERLVYDASQLTPFFKSELLEAGENTGCCGGPVNSEEAIDRAANELAGKIWSAKFHAHKPIAGRQDEPDAERCECGCE